MNSVPNTPGRSPLTEKQQKRLAMLRSFAGTPQQRRDARYAKPLLVLFLGGLAFVLGGFMTYGNPAEELRHDSWLYIHFGPASGPILMVLVGVAMLMGGAFLLRRMLRNRKAAEMLQQSRPI